jgi:RNA polymerase sigma-70 factor (ECF subfamily)
LILNAREDASRRRAAFEHLSRSYWGPVYCFFRRRGLAREEAQDTTQGLFALLLEHEPFSALDPSRGKCRSYLLRAASNYLSSARRAEGRLKRGGHLTFAPLEVDRMEARLECSPEDPEKAFQRAWTLELVYRALSRLKEQHASGGYAGPFEILERVFGAGEVPEYKLLAAEFGMEVNALKSFIHRARKRFHSVLLEEIAGTLADPGAAAEELRLMFQG